MTKNKNVKEIKVKRDARPLDAIKLELITLVNGDDCMTNSKYYVFNRLKQIAVGVLALVEPDDVNFDLNIDDYLDVQVFNEGYKKNEKKKI